MADELSRRDQILNAAERLLHHYGFAKTTVADIAREANIGVGSVYLEFGTKDEIVAALSIRGHQAGLEAMAKMLAEEGEYYTRLRSALDARLRHYHGLAQSGVHSFDLVQCRCPAVGEIHRRFRAAEEELLAKFLKAAHRAKEFSVPDATVVARTLLWIFDGFMPPHIQGLSREDLWELIDTTENMLLDGLARRG